ncbi:Peptidyl-prolyl cis-trans isomerase CYP40 [Hibiscus syriacus]|uniref:Peptidyl-prolyl cis-trans isomerase CYP40 n=1 Tax=Hibiscus syriacus TaxID=106335 RepID=A0A6A2ZIZ5_HIBSY|nr:Peptidyl-prolyl cis-trans isomerase CYP40 [Hibiscus syriacus]
MGVVRSIEHVATEDGDYPTQDVIIEDCGEIPEGADDGVSIFFKDGDIYPDWPADLDKKMNDITWWMMAVDSIKAFGNEQYEKQDYKIALRNMEGFAHWMLGPGGHLSREFLYDCKLKLGDLKGALLDTDFAIRDGEENVKAFFCQGQAHMTLNEIDVAVESFKKASKLEPNDGLLPIDETRRKGHTLECFSRSLANFMVHQQPFCLLLHTLESEGSHKSRPSITDLPTDSNNTYLKTHDLLKLVNPLKKKPRPPKLIEFCNIKISQVELSIMYEGSRFVVSDLKLLMDTFHRVEFTGTWRRLISRKFKDSGHNQQPTTTAPDGEFHLLDNDQASDQKRAFPKRSADGAGDGFITFVRGLFNNQRRKAKQFVLRTMRGEEEGDQQGQLSDGNASATSIDSTTHG